MAEKKVIEIDIETNVSSLKSQLREAQAEVAKLADKFGATSKEATEAAKRAAELKDRIGDAKALTDAFNPDAKFNALSASIGGVLNGFQAYEGALGLIGVESEQVQATLLKVQSAMALSQGLQGLGEARDSFVQLGAVATNFGNKALESFRAMSTASKAFAITGIGLLITGLTLVITYWDDVSKAIGLSTDEQDKYIAKQKRINEESKQMQENVSKESAQFATLITRLKETNAGSKERESLIKDINKQYGTTLKNLSDEAEFQNQLNKELENYLEYQRQKFLLQSNEEKIQKNLTVQQEIQSKILKLEKERDQIQKDRDKLAQRSDALGLGDLDNKLAVINDKLNLQNIELSNAKKRFADYGASANNASKSIDELTYSGKKYTEQSVEDAEKLSESLFIIDDEELKRREAQRKMDAENLALYLGDMTMLKTNSALDELTKYKEVRDKELEIDKATAEKKKALEQDVKRAKIQIAVDTLNLIQNVAELFGRNDEKRAKQAFNIDKVAKISSAIMSGIEGTINAYKTAQSSPITALFPAYPAIQAGLAGAFAATNIAKLSATKFGATSNGGNLSSTSGGGQTFTPSFNVVGNSGINQLATLQQQPVKAYITAGEVSSALSLERNTLQKTTF